MTNENQSKNMEKKRAHPKYFGTTSNSRKNHTPKSTKVNNKGADFYNSAK